MLAKTESVALIGTEAHLVEVERAHAKRLPIALNDGQGLYFRKQSAEGASWVLRYKFAGRPTWIAVVNYPDMPLSAARQAARAMAMLPKAKLRWLPGCGHVPMNDAPELVARTIRQAIRTPASDRAATAAS